MKPRFEGTKCRTKHTNPDPPSQVIGGIAWRYGGLEDEKEDYEYRVILLGEESSCPVRGAKLP